MAKGQSLGFLNFGIDGDDTEMKKKLKSLREDAISIEKVFKNIKIDTGASKLSTDVQKAQLAADKLALSNEKVVKSIHETQKAEERLANERKKGSVLEQQRAKEAARAALEIARSGEIELNMLHKKANAQQQAEISAARLEGINKRNALIGVKGQQDFKKSVDASNKSLNNQGGLLTGIEKKIVSAFSAYQLARFAKEIINIRGQFQGLELGFETMLGSADKSRKMKADITEISADLDKQEKAAEYLEQILAIDPEYGIVKFRLAIVRFEIGEKEPFIAIINQITDRLQLEMLTSMFSSFRSREKREKIDYTQFSREELLARLDESRECYLQLRKERGNK